MASSITAAFRRSCTLGGTGGILARKLAPIKPSIPYVRSYGGVQTLTKSRWLGTRITGTTRIAAATTNAPSFLPTPIVPPRDTTATILHNPGLTPYARTLTTFATTTTSTPPHHNPLLPHPSTAGSRRTMASQKHKRVIKQAKGYRGRANRTFRAAIRRVEKGMQYAYRDRKTKKRNFRRLWIERVNAGVRQHGMSYSRLIDAMNKIGGREMVEAGKEEGIIINRKMLADLAGNEPFSFKAVVDVVKVRSRELAGDGGYAEDRRSENVA